MSSRTDKSPTRWRWSFLVDLGRATPTVRLLVLTQMTFNVGFFMVLPYLSVHLTSDLGLGAALVGVVLGIRTFSQQGLFFVGGTLADRWGIKPVVLVGCVLRVLGFLGLAAFDSLAGVVAATVLVGFAAALFSPAVESAIAIEAGKSERSGGATRVQTFALLSVCNQIGSFTGPLIGSLLLLADFRIACLTAAVIFVLVIAAHIRWLPREPGEHRDDPWLSGWTDVIRNRTFVLFAVAMSAQLVAYNQLYLLLPLEVERAWGSQTVLGWFFAISAVLVVTTQLPITRRVATVSPRITLPIGFAVMAFSFALVAVLSPLELTGLVGLIPAALFVLLLALGQMIAMPQARDLVPLMAAERRLGSYYGFMASLGGIGVLLGSIAVGAVIDASPDTGWGAAIPWLVAALFPIASVIGLRIVLARLD
ncbi:MFS transporter [Rhodococcus fascians]|nr:MFS transporter [Rhodococcus fascians]MBY3827717.1 MFS transporter [Rhodococcus fascians]MBY3838295.1 MFS transporter [Rhodococcus fascians]MBY3867567.1 MFS transporter [Rhodococcus fascians]MBY3886599.1 MFS transporter [Rhodococcus fascians]